MNAAAAPYSVDASSVESDEKVVAASWWSCVKGYFSTNNNEGER